MMFTKEELIKATGAVVLRDELKSDGNFEVSTDTRTIKSSDIYLPLKGASFDGEDFIDNAIIAGAKAYFTTKDYINENADFILKVENTTNAYLDIAKYQRIKKNPKVVAITGSSGKTTTKEIIYSVLSQHFRTHKTFSNHNNEIGFCQTVLSMPEDTEVLVVEMGMRGLGEIELISTHLIPDYAIITNSGSAHVGRLGSLDNIAIAKCEITSGLKQEGVFIAKNQDIIKKHVNFEGEKIYYSIEDVEILEKSKSYTKFRYKDEEYVLNVEGDYNVENSLAAIELGLKMDVPPSEIKQGLLSYKPIEKRWEVENVNGLQIINDSYNANPESMKASVKTFVELYKKPIVVLGNMGELGEDEVFYHSEVGSYIADICKGKDVKFITVGNLALNIAKVLADSGYKVNSFETNEQASCYIVENLNAGYTIFLKASRSMKFEQIIEGIKRGIVSI